MFHDLSPKPLFLHQTPFYTRHVLHQTTFTTNNFYTRHPLQPENLGHQTPFDLGSSPLNFKGVVPSLKLTANAPKNGSSWNTFSFPIGFRPIFRGYVSFREGIPKSSILIGVFIINHPFWGVKPPLFLETNFVDFAGSPKPPPVRMDCLSMDGAMFGKLWEVWILVRDYLAWLTWPMAKP